LFSIAFAHLINDLMQSVIPAAYRFLKKTLVEFYPNWVNYFRIPANGLFIATVYSFIQIKPKPYSLAIGMVFTISGLALLSIATQFWMILVAVSLVGIGSSIFHPEASRVAFLVLAGKRFGPIHLSVGWYTGSAIGPLLFIIVAPYGQSNIIWFVLVGILGIFVLTKIAVWYQNHLNLRASKKQSMRKKQFHFRKENKNCNRSIITFNIFEILLYVQYVELLLLLDAQI
jgi:FSR family fosmidomycin resistance protein-like MFS transporter